MGLVAVAHDRLLFALLKRGGGAPALPPNRKRLFVEGRLSVILRQGLSACSNHPHQVLADYSRGADDATHQGTDDTVCRQVLARYVKTTDWGLRAQPFLLKALGRGLDPHEATTLTFGEGLVA